MQDKCPNCGRPIPPGVINKNPFWIAQNVYWHNCQCGTSIRCYSLENAVSLDFAALDGITSDYRNIHHPPELADVVRSFVANVDRIVSLAFFSKWLLWAYRDYGRLLDDVLRKLGVIEELVTRDTGEYENAMIETAKKQMIGRREDVYGIVCYTTLKSSILHEVCDGLGVDDLLAFQTTEGAVLSARLIMSSMLVAAWTSLEVVAGDLWVAALNCRPRLGLLAINAAPDPGDSEGAASRKERTPFQVPAYLLRDRAYDLTSSMGTLLKSKWDFATRKGARDAYQRIFDRQAVFDRVFDDPSMKTLAACRNAIVHNAGLADREFIKIVGKDACFNQLSEGDPLPLTGPIVTRYSNEAIERGKALIDFVGSWLTSNST